MHWCRIKIDQCELTFINTNKMGKDFVSSRTCCFDMKYSKCQCGGIGTARERCWDLNIKYTLGLECRNLHGYNIELIQQWKDGYFFINFSENLTKIIRTSMTQCKKQKYLPTTSGVIVWEVGLQQQKYQIGFLYLAEISTKVV